MLEKKEILWKTSRQIRDLDEHQISLKGNTYSFILASRCVCLRTGKVIWLIWYIIFLFLHLPHMFNQHTIYWYDTVPCKSIHPPFLFHCFKTFNLIRVLENLYYLIYTTCLQLWRCKKHFLLWNKQEIIMKKRKHERA